MGVKNAFLNYDLTEEEVHMQLLLGYYYLSHKVCHLCQALYGLEQAPIA